MTFTQAVESVNAFFESYCDNFNRLNGSAIADLFAYPSHITSDMGDIRDVNLMSIPTKKEWVNEIEHLLDMYRTIGFGSAHILKMTPTEISPRLVQAVIHWAIRDTEGHLLYEFQAIYTLAKLDGELRIAALLHNELPSLLACRSRLQS